MYSCFGRVRLFFFCYSAINGQVTEGKLRIGRARGAA
jgi:hypothetical protein